LGVPISFKVELLLPCNGGIIMEEIMMMNATIEIDFMMPTITKDDLFIEE